MMKLANPVGKTLGSKRSKKVEDLFLLWVGLDLSNLIATNNTFAGQFLRVYREFHGNRMINSTTGELISVIENPMNCL